MQHRVAELPTELEGLRARFSGEELRRALETYRAQVERAYAQFAGRGEETWEQAAREAAGPPGDHDAGVVHGEARLPRRRGAGGARARALAAASRQTRATGEKVAQGGQRLSGRAADAVVDASAAAADAVEDAGTAAAGAIEEAGDEAAAATRKATRTAPPAPRVSRRGGPAACARPSPEVDRPGPPCRGMTPVGRAT